MTAVTVAFVVETVQAKLPAASLDLSLLVRPYSRPLILYPCPSSLHVCLSVCVHCRLQDYVKTICAILDIPVHPGGSAVQSLHVLFTLYSEFKNNPHFGNLGGGAGASSTSVLTSAVLAASLILGCLCVVAAAAPGANAGAGSDVMTF